MMRMEVPNVTCRNKRLATAALSLLAVALSVDLAVTVNFRTVDVPQSKLVGLYVIYGFWIALSVLSALLLQLGRSRTVALSTVIALAGFVLLVVTIALLRNSAYKPPPTVWISHAAVFAALALSAVLVVRCRAA
jgi:hypothetical protein